MSVQLPLRYIRPFRSKCFAGGLLHFHGSDLRTRGLLGRNFPWHQPHTQWVRCRPHTPFYVQNTRKERILIPQGRETRWLPTYFLGREGSPNGQPGRCISGKKTAPLFRLSL